MTTAAHIPPAAPPADATVNIASYLPMRAQQQPDTLAVAFPLDSKPVAQRQYLQWSYKQLNDESDIIARGLLSIGIARGMRTVLMVTPSPEFFALVFALFKIGAVLVAVDPGMGVKNLKTCLGEAQPEAFIGIRKAHFARKLLGWAKDTLRINVLVGRKLLPFGKTIAISQVRQRGLASSHPVLAPTTRDETAAILFTSGSTGIPKGAVYTHGNFDAQVRALIDLFQIKPGEIDLCTFPLFALYAPAMGMSAIVPRMDFTRPGSVDPKEVIEPIQRFNVTNLFGSPALLKRIAPPVTTKTEPTPKAEGLPSLGSDAHDAHDAHEPRDRSPSALPPLLTTAQSAPVLPTLKRVISAGAPVPARTIARITTLLAPHVQVFTPYGATECLPVACIGSDEILGDTSALTDQGKGICVGRPVPNLDVRVIRIDDEPIERWSDSLELPPGEIGEIVVRGGQATRQYFNRESSTRLGKISNDGGAFHRMGDVGYFDDQGRLWYCGRKSERVVTAERTYFTAPCEGVLDTLVTVERTALVPLRIGDAIAPGVCVELHHTPGVRDRRSWSAVREGLASLAAQHACTRGITQYFLYPQPFPTDIRHNSKINRPLLAKWAAKQLGGEPA